MLESFKKIGELVRNDPMHSQLFFSMCTVVYK